MKTTNYINTFIEVADDCPAAKAEIPPLRGKAKTAARIQYELISDNPYGYTSDEVIFHVHADKQKIADEDKPNERERFFSKGQPCMRASALAKRYGWGVHSDASGRIAIYPVESDEYKKLVNNNNLNHLKAMRSKRA